MFEAMAFVFLCLYQLFFRTKAPCNLCQVFALAFRLGFAYNRFVFLSVSMCRFVVARDKGQELKPGHLLFCVYSLYAYCTVLHIDQEMFIAKIFFGPRKITKTKICIFCMWFCPMKRINAKLLCVEDSNTNLSSFVLVKLAVISVGLANLHVLLHAAHNQSVNSCFDNTAAKLPLTSVIDTNHDGQISTAWLHFLVMLRDAIRAEQLEVYKHV